MAPLLQVRACRCSSDSRGGRLCCGAQPPTLGPQAALGRESGRQRSRRCCPLPLPVLLVACSIPVADAACVRGLPRPPSLLQGYGLTETTAASFVMLPNPKMAYSGAWCGGRGGGCRGEGGKGTWGNDQQTRRQHDKPASSAAPPSSRILSPVCCAPAESGFLASHSALAWTPAQPRPISRMPWLQWAPRCRPPSSGSSRCPR
jgi:hypothetical protein